MKDDVDLLENYKITAWFYVSLLYDLPPIALSASHNIKHLMFNIVITFIGGCIHGWTQLSCSRLSLSCAEQMFNHVKMGAIDVLYSYLIFLPFLNLLFYQ